MAKDNPEDQTAPIYNPDGTIYGYTTPEKAAELEATFAAPDFNWGMPATEEADPFANPDQTTGFHDDNAGITYWDYATQSYVTTDVTGNPTDLKNELDLGYYQNSQGDYVYGTPPDNKYLSPDGGIYISGIDPNGHGLIETDGGGLSFGGDGNIVSQPTPGYNDDGTLIDPVTNPTQPTTDDPFVTPTETTDTGQPQGNVQQPNEDGSYPLEEGDSMTYIDGVWGEPSIESNPGWHDNKAFILSKIADGTATPEQQGWYDKYTWRMDQNPLVEEPVVEEPVVQEPVVQEPVVEDPTVPDNTPTTDPNTPIEDPNEEVIDPIIEEPTDDWFWTDPVDYTNAPQPDGDGEFVTGGPPVDTSWDWNFFRDKAPGDRQWGGYDEDYQAFERYQPGMDSPWGMPNIKGGNEDFYQQQFVNQLRDEQGFRSRQRDADRNRQLVAEEQATGTGYYAPTDPAENWSWAYGGQGLPDVQMGTGVTGGESPQYTLNSAFTSGETTRDDILRWAQSAGGFSQAERDWYGEVLQRGGDNGDSTYWASRSDPNELINNLKTEADGGFNSTNIGRMTNLFNSLYNPSGASVNGPTAPVGYASPIQGSTG